MTTQTTVKNEITKISTMIHSQSDENKPPRKNI
jgi:hypothetical protein